MIKPRTNSIYTQPPNTYWLFLLCVLLLSGCGNQARKLSAIDVENPLTRIAGLRSFQTADAASFSKAVVKYQAANGYHNIPVGDYYLAQIIQAVPEGIISSLRLLEFDTLCDRVNYFFPDTHCHLFSLIEVEKTGYGKRTYEIKVNKLLENYYQTTSPWTFGYIKLSERPILEQMRLVLDEASEALAKKIMSKEYPVKRRSFRFD